jgi:phenylpropionate dioxygenase-like ring-hydroxylating dioxygenase large terminal subunit
MKSSAALDLHRRVCAALDAGAAPAPAHADTVSVSNYLSEAQSQHESALLRRYPQPIAASSALPAPGAWLATHVLDTPFLLVRQADGVVHAFLNVCRHRGAQVVPDGAGLNATVFVCPYHAWSYTPDGALRALPKADGFPCLDKAASGLRRLASCERAGMIWVFPDPALANTDPNDTLGPLMDELESLTGLQNPIAYAPRSYELNANWKLLIDGSFEAYHFKIAHKNTVGPLFIDNLQLIDEVGLNRRLYLVKAAFASERPSAADFAPRRYGNLIYFFFPNTMYLVQPDHAQLSWLEPLDAHRTRVHELTLIPESPVSDKAIRHWDANIDLYRRTLGEDYTLAETIQAGMASGANDVLTFGTFEYSAPRFHEQLRGAIDSAANT